MEQIVMDVRGGNGIKSVFIEALDCVFILIQKGTELNRAYICTYSRIQSLTIIAYPCNKSSVANAIILLVLAASCIYNDYDTFN